MVVTLAADGTGTVSDSTGVLVTIETRSHADTIMWRIDGGDRHFAYQDNEHDERPLFVPLHEGQHTMQRLSGCVSWRSRDGCLRRGWKS